MSAWKTQDERLTGVLDAYRDGLMAQQEAWKAWNGMIDEWGVEEQEDEPWRLRGPRYRRR